MKHCHTLRALFGVCLLLFVLRPAVAAEAALSVRIAVESQQPEVREQVTRQALSQILLRMTGRDDLAESEAAAPLLERPGRFLQRYQYESQPGQQLVLLMQFDGTAIRRALAGRGVPTWSADRPPVLVWLAVEQGGRRLLVGGEEGGDIRAQLQAAAARRGVLLLFPLMDSEDRQKVSGADVFGGFTERVQQASERYGTPLMVMGRMYREGGGWAARWTLSERDSVSWNTAGPTLGEVLNSAAVELATRLQTRYAILPTPGSREQQLVIQVAGVSTLRDYDRLERRLRSVGGVTDVRPLALEPDTVMLQLAFEIAPERVWNALRQDRALVLVSALRSGADSEQDLQTPVFRLIP